MERTTGFLAFIPLLLLMFISQSEAYIICSDLEICSGSGAYCCGDSCCFSVWTFWWFWFLWIFIFICVMTCGYACRRRYTQQRSQQQYLIVAQPQAYQYTGPGVYGAVEARAAGGSHAHASATAPTVPQKPPAYLEKPPEYTPC